MKVGKISYSLELFLERLFIDPNFHLLGVNFDAESRTMDVIVQHEGLPEVEESSKPTQIDLRVEDLPNGRVVKSYSW